MFNRAHRTKSLSQTFCWFKSLVIKLCTRWKIPRQTNTLDVPYAENDIPVSRLIAVSTIAFTSWFIGAF